MYQSTRVDHLGFPRRKSEDGDAEGWYEARIGKNWPQSVMDDWNKDNKDGLGPGEYLYVIDTRD